MSPETRRHERRLAVFLALTLLVVAALCLLAFRSLREVKQASHDVVYDYSRRLIHVLELHVASENKVAAVRGYLMTGNPFHVDRLNAARETVQARLRDLERAVTTDRGRELLATVRDKDAAHEQLTDRMARMKAGGVPDAQIFSTLAAEAVPARLELERAIQAFVEQERRLLDGKQAESEQLGRRHERALVLGGAVALITLLWLALLMRNTYRGLARKEADLQSAIASEAAERTRYADLVNNLDHSVVWEATAVEGELPLRFNFVSERAQMVCGHSSRQWVESAESFFRPIPEEDRPGIERMLKGAATSLQDGRCEHRFRTAHKGEIWVQSGVHPKKLDDGRVHFIGLTVDITPLRKARSDLDATLQERDLQEASLQKAVEARDSVLAIVSHDLRTPLATIMHAATVLAAKAGDPRHNPARQAELITRAGRQMNRLIEDLLAAAQMSAGQYVARGIVEAHGGRLWVESEFGSGTTFYFTLPVKP